VTPIPVRGTGLTKHYGEFVAVDGIDFHVDAGECVAFLGPNGAGKTTTVKMITGFSPITAGTVSVLGLDVSRDPREVKARIGICQQEDSLDPDFTVRQNLIVYARFFDIPGAVAKRRTDELLDLVRLTDKADAQIQELSGGMRRRLMLARSLLNEPQLLILDEPTTGLDPQARQLIWKRVRRLRAEGRSILLTTHYMEEASQLCDRVIIMDHARIHLEGKPQDLVSEIIGREVVELWDTDGVVDELREFVNTLNCTIEETEDRVYVYDRDGRGVGEEIGRRFPHQPRLIRHATLEDVFLHRTGRSLKE
jgi:lipooligosaccharide transport system ATP-binding protein